MSFDFKESVKFIVFKRLFLLISSLTLSFSAAWAGSYDDFFKAIAIDDAPTVQALLNRGFDPNTPSPQGSHGLMLAMQDNNLKVARVLIRHRQTNVDPRNKQDETPLMMAALKGDTELVLALIARGADINKPGWAPLHYAATKGSVPIVRELLDKSAYIDAESPNGTTPLMMAAMYGTPEVVKILLEAGADPTIKNGLGLTALDFAKTMERNKESATLISAFLAGWGSR